MTNEYKYVPTEPTDEMVKAAFDQFEISAPGFTTGNDARRAIYAAMLAAAPEQPSHAQSLDREAKTNVTLDGCLETLFRIGEHLGIDYATARKAPGAPSEVFITAIEAIRNEAIEEVINQLKISRDTSYLRYIEMCRLDLCLGEEEKLNRRKFGVDELEAHKIASEYLGAHKAFASAVDRLMPLKSQPAQPSEGDNT